MHIALASNKDLAEFVPEPIRREDTQRWIGDIMVRFNEWVPAQYRLFNIRTVIAPADSLAVPPGLLAARERFGRPKF